MSDADVPDDWADWDEEEVPPVVSSPPPKATTSSGPAAQGPKEYKVPKSLATKLDDPAAEAERKLLIQEHRDLVFSGDMLGVDAGQEAELIKRGEALASKYKIGMKKAAQGSGPSLASLSVNRLQEIEELCDLLAPKISESPAKSGSWLQFLDRLLAACGAKMDPKDLQTLGKKVKDLQTKREVEKRALQTSSKKGTDLKVNIRNYADELDIFDGKYDGDGDDSQDDDMDDDDDGNDEFM
eukprot:Protomagalhaensia_wolfi_Nauph_80__2428@NODE_2605_length_1041_cov_124_834331_g2039_i0_p1_GENE_NODE_2605_length_1041_cov_124_834331_g2039_i0NODE_2605_length_1041_cov_124_834331_g2039_i0_p1_ORF_typecomplete_len249_score68_31eIF3_subunit/PF08597_10/3_1e20MRPS27/PF10037_9/0_1_NODE_2605_length_1041_cov_124_834331_g2039_i028747